MKTSLPSFHSLAHGHLPAGLRPIGLGILVVVYSSELVFAGKPHRSAVAEAAPTDEMLRLDPGAIGVRAASQSALWSYDLPQGQVCRAAEAAGAAAATALELPAVDRNTDLFTSVIGAVAAPVAAAVSGVRAARERLPAHKLTEVQTGLVNAMTNLAQQQHLRDAVIAAAQGQNSRRFVRLDAEPDSWLGREQNRSVGTILQTSVSELRLVRLGANDASFALRIEARARLLRVADNRVLADTMLTYQTEPELFLDWALNAGEPFAKCAQTGYRHLANQIISDLVRRTGEERLFVGPGRKNSLPKTASVRHAKLEQQSHPIAPVATVHFAAQSIAAAGNLYVIPSPPSGFFTMQKPLTRDEALSEAMSDIEWAMDGMDRHPNVLVTLAAVAVFAPVGFYHQTLGLAFNGVPEKTIRTADHSLARAINRAQPSQALATQIAQHLGAREFDRVVLLTKPGNGSRQLVQAPTSEPRRILTTSAASATDNIQAGDQMLKIEVVKTALCGSGGSNPKLALCVEARVTLLSASAGPELYACTVRYQSAAYKYARWAADEAQLFRAELTRSYEQLSATALDEMVVRGWITPTQMPATLARSGASHVPPAGSEAPRLSAK